MRREGNIGIRMRRYVDKGTEEVEVEGVASGIRHESIELSSISR